MKVSKEIRKNAVDYSMNAITDICTNIGPRESGMPKEREAQEWIKNQIDTNGWADESAIEDFKVSRHALVGFTKIIGVFLIIGALLQLLTLIGNPALTLAVRIISLVLAVLSIVIVVLEFLFYVPFIDKFLPETTSCNVYAKYKPTGDVKRRIIINGHTDSAYEWTLMKIRQEVMVGVLAVDLLCALASIVIFSINIAKGVTPLWSVIFAACTVVAYIGLFFVCNFKVLSPGALVAKRFFRNRLAVVGMSILIFMFVFSFIGGLISPYGEDEFFYRDDQINKEFAVVTENTDFRYKAKDADKFTAPVQAQTMLAIQKSSETFSYSGTDYTLTPEGKDFYSIATGGAMIGIAYKDVVSPSNEGDALSFEFIYAALKSYAALEQETEGETPDTPAAPVETTEPAAPAEPAVKTFTVDGVDYVIDEVGSVLQGDTEVAYVSRYIVQAILPDVFLSRDFKEKLIDTIAVGGTKFTYTDESLILNDEPDAALDDEETGIGAMDDALVEEDDTASDATMEYTIERSQNHANWVIRQQQASRQYDSYQFPSSTHWLGTDRYGMDMLTRLMYGGRVSLMIGFIVIIIETVLGVILGGVAGYFGGWVDNLIMRLVDIFYCIPSMPIILILGAAMDNMRVEPGKRLIYLMLILGILGWAGIARLVRGQILSLREQEFMTATEACGISVKSRIFKHLIPNVIPQLIVNCTMGLGSVIITEATLSFLGLGVKFPFASWGNIINDVNNTHTLTTYWFIWIPAGMLLLLTVLAFNLVGDGLRDAFDPKMKR